MQKVLLYLEFSKYMGPNELKETLRKQRDQLRRHLVLTQKILIQIITWVWFTLWVLE
jgi:predicted nucleic acid-binding Zn ribbon protein